jgi:cation diffusion facilitator family transporter
LTIPQILRMLKINFTVVSPDVLCISSHAGILTMGVSKHTAAVLSVGASILLTVVKVLVGMLTGSLSILAEAIDSVLDLLAAGVTFLVVRVADLPPDENHPYGHARAENLGALAQTVLLVATAALVLWHALERILFMPVIPEVTIWSFLVIIISLIINVARVYTLHRTARETRSHTLAANVANFANDILGSLLVLVALGLIALDPWLNLPSWLIVRADAIAAALVALVAIRVAWMTGQQAIGALMDDVPPDLSRSLLERVSQLPDVVPDSAHIRTRFVGEQPYVEVTVGTPRGRSLEEAHQLADDVEHAVRTELNEANVLVHVKPARTPAEPYATAIYSLAHNLGLRVHNLDLFQLSDRVLAEMDLELPGSLTLAEAHVHSEQLEAAIAAELPCCSTIMIHLEPRHDQMQPAVRYTPLVAQVQRAIDTLPDAALLSLDDALLIDKGVVVLLHRTFPGTMRLTEVHDIMAEIERNLQYAMPEIAVVQIDPELDGTAEQQPQPGNRTYTTTA